jgi:tetratricopeptide (TPR) repeat protein
LEQALELYPENWEVIEQAARFFADFDSDRAGDLLSGYENGRFSTEAELLKLRIDGDPVARGYPARLWRLIEEDADEPALRYAAWYFRSHGSQVDLRQALNRSIDQLGRKYWVVAYEAMLAADSGDWDAAAELFTESHELVPDWRTAYDAALSWYRAGWPERGAEMLARARRLAAYSDERARSEVYTTSARTAADVADARAYLEEALSIAPSSAETLYLMRTLASSRE